VIYIFISRTEVAPWVDNWDGIVEGSRPGEGSRIKNILDPGVIRSMGSLQLDDWQNQ
jgi:hypothetical protein